MSSPRKRKTQVSASERISMCAEHSWDCVAGQRPARWKNCRSEFLLATMCQAWVPRAPGSRGKTCGARGSCSVWSAATLSQTMLSRFEHKVCVHSKKNAPALVSQRLFPDFLGALPRPAGDGACWRTLLVPPVCLGTQGGQNILGCFRIQNTPTR